MVYKENKICAFVANDAGKYAFQKLIKEELVDCVVTITAKKAEKLGVSNYLDVSKIYNGEIYYAKKYNLKSAEDVNFFEQKRFDVGFILGWNRLIPKEIIDTFKYGIYGFHGTPFKLPKGRGRSPTIWAIALGYKEFYLHMFKINEGIDEGEIYGTKKIEIYETDTIKFFHLKTSYAAYELIMENLENITSGKPGIPQEGTPVYFRRRDEKDGKINWNFPTKRIYDLIRAITKPYPGAWTTLNGEKIRIWEAVPFSKYFFENKKPGTICAVFDEGFVVKTGDGSILITHWSPKIVIKEGDLLI